MTSERWSTDEELAAATRRFTDRIPGYVHPAAWSVARVDDGDLTFGEINGIGNARRLSAAVLASVCGYSNRTMTKALTASEMAKVIGLLTPAEASTHVEHPNLWSWQMLVADASPGSSYVAVFVADPADDPVDATDAEFRAHLTTPTA